VKRYYDSDNLPADTPPPVVILGNFDGVHLGHRRLIEMARQKAQALNGVTVVYTFDPHPVRILAPHQCPPLLQTLEQKLAMLEELGVDICVVERFTEKFAHLTPEVFFEQVIMKRLGAAAMVVGYDFTFGIHRHGTTESLQSLGKEYGVEAIIVEAQFQGETLISSTNIRQMIAGGEVGAAAALLGRPYSLAGRVVPGRGTGRTLAAHTANMETKNEVIPKDGVYVSLTQVQGDGKGERYPSITSIGNNPTFPMASFAIETHLIDVDMDIMGREVVVEFLKWMRDQMTFATIDELKDQIHRDVDAARQYHDSRGGKPK
jgi:riboflavin kinase/FMN adenylyltransferase